METLYAEISDVLDSLEDKWKSFGYDGSNTNKLQDNIMQLKDMLKTERNDYNVCMHYYTFIILLTGFLVYETLQSAFSVISYLFPSSKSFHV